jgi:AraC-like DNA-binding protein
MLEADIPEVQLKLGKELTEFRDRRSENTGAATPLPLNDRPGRNEVLRSRRLERVVRAMSGQLALPITNEFLANFVRLSPCYFNRVLRDVTGIPSVQFHYVLRLDRGKRLLIGAKTIVANLEAHVGDRKIRIAFVSRFKELVGFATEGLPALRPAGLLGATYPSRWA